ncbi:Protease prsW family protein [Micromonospora citrea]|uniref:Protease prsW family protein n=1 Tax=Micromonospora citrea TaxID=47855 RepID=A0A1C6UR15_9ACTN|nr:PrsW family intramembrane metalloprotease [Micromonospora citrea]SCL56502.1 Protease prsW family protein [Micromonospora citrea]
MTEDDSSPRQPAVPRPAADSAEAAAQPAVPPPPADPAEAAGHPEEPAAPAHGGAATPAATVATTTTETPGAYRFDRLGAVVAIGGALLALIAAAAFVAVVRDDDDDLRIFGAINLVGIGITLLAASAAVTVAAIVSARSNSRRTRFLACAIGGALVFVVPAILMALSVLLSVAVAWRGALLSVPTTVFALWTFRRMQRNRRPPWWLILVAFAWGLLVASYFSQMVEVMLHTVVTAEVPPGTATIIAHSAAAAFPEELVKGAGVAAVVLLAWRRVDGMLGGIVVGACVGLGFQFAESISYMTQNFDAVLYQHWYRQVTGLLVSHATYTGIIGAGVGLATQLNSWPRRVTCAASGFAFAVAAHLVWDICAMGHFYWESDDPTIQLFVAQPVNLLVLKGPAFAVLLFLVVLALRRETRSLHRQLRAEAADPTGAVTPAEVSVLLDAPRRFMMRLHTLLWESPAAYRRIKRLHAAQLDLAFARWRRERGEPQPPSTEEALRQLILELKTEAPAPDAPSASRRGERHPAQVAP